MLQIGIALFLGCFFFGSILSNFIWQDTAWWIGSAGDTDWQQILADGEQRERFFGQVLILRGIPWIILQIFLFISWGRWVFAGWYGWLGVSGGMVTGGTIRVDGQDIRNIKLSDLRNHIGIVQQDVYLFAGTILENIRYGKPDASREEVIRAAKEANAHEFIMNFPDGYDTDIGQRGVKLSGGQKQRLSIARVFLKNPPILIFDEATSALDNESEKVVQESLEILAKGRTTFVIAHRLSTIRNAQRILVLTENGIEESGTHAELLAKGGIYQKLCEMSNLS